MAAEKARLEAANARYELWSAGTAATRQAAGQAKAELARRGQEPAARDASEPQAMTEWWRQFQADADAMDRAIQREHQVAIEVGQPWPPARQAQPDPEPHSTLLPEAPRPGQPEIPEAGAGSTDARTARLDVLQTRASAAAARIAADTVERDARAEYVARSDRQTQAESETVPQAEALPDAEMEL